MTSFLSDGGTDRLPYASATQLASFLRSLLPTHSPARSSSTLSCAPLPPVVSSRTTKQGKDVSLSSSAGPVSKVPSKKKASRRQVRP